MVQHNVMSRALNVETMALTLSGPAASRNDGSECPCRIVVQAIGQFRTSHCSP